MTAERSPTAGSDGAAGARQQGALAILLGLVLLKLALHLLVNARGGYGWFRDELYYIACSEHLDLGYVDQPPLSIYLLAGTRALLCDSLFAVRLLPALAGAATVLLTGLLARRLGGGRWAVALAAMGSVVSLIHLGIDAIYSMNGFDLLLWVAAAYLLVRLIQSGEARLWPLLGLVVGLGLLNKISVLWLAAGIFAALVLTPQRKWLRTRWPWIAGLIAALLFLPYVYWNLRHGLAHLEFMRNASGTKYAGLSVLSFLTGQLRLQNPVTLPLWAAGLVFCLGARRARELRPLGIVYLTAFVILVVNRHSKAEYLAPGYSMLFATGGVALESWCSARGRRWLLPAYLCLLAAGLIFAPAVLPILPVSNYLRYAQALGIAPSTAEGKELAELPQYYADMFGWEDKAKAVARVYQALPAQDRAKCAIFGDNYGRCAAIDFFGAAYGLPKSIGCHNSYWLWGPRQYNGDLVLILGGELKDKQEKFESVVVADSVSTRYCMPYENNLKIYVCRNLKQRLPDVWSMMKSYN
jgi:hypothetical protein